MKIQNCSFIVVSFILFLSSPVVSQSMGITYNIPMFNHSGAFSINLGTSLNKSTNETERVIEVLDAEGKLVKIINKESIEKMINAIKAVKKLNKINRQNNNSMINNEKLLTSLEELNKIFDTPGKLESIFEKSNDTKSVTSGLPWSYTIQTIRGVSVPMSGNLNW